MTTLELHNGDCLEIMKTLPAESIDLFLCDLPYGCLTNPKIGGGQNIRLPENRCAWDIKLDLDKFWEQIKRLRRNENSPCLMFCTTKFGYELIKSNEKEFRYDLVWDKQRGVSFLSANKMPMRSHEMIYVFSKAGAYYNRVDLKGDFKSFKVNKEGLSTKVYGIRVKGNNRENDGTTRCPLSIIQINAMLCRKRNQHPTEKPMELYKWLIERYCPPGGTVLDPTAGSFNSVFAAYDMNKNAIGIEKDEGFYDKGCKRIERIEQGTSE